MPHAPAARYRVDATMYATVIVCLVPGCGARWLTSTRRSGLLILADHVSAHHPRYENVPAQRAKAA